MNRKTRRIILTWFLCVCLVFSTAVLGHAYSGILTFGDSLSDNGNADSFGIQRFSNGPVWVEYLAGPAHFNIPLFDMAFGGATTGYDNPAAGLPITGLNWQVDTYLTLFSSQISTETLVTVWAGPNDLFQGRSYTTAADNVELALTKLANAGFQNFLVVNLPDIGATPEFAGTPASPLATAWCQTFNTMLTADLVDLQITFPGDHFHALDAYSLVRAAIANPAAYGFTNVTDPLYPNYYGTGYLFWDGVHPTTEAHLMLSSYAAASVPEPTTILLYGLGFAGAGVYRRLRRGRK